jgi:glycosyltransferase involved in cell wall biosynthesis
MKLLFLYTEVMGYTEIVLETLKENYNARIILIHWDRKKLTKHKLSVTCEKIIPRSTVDKSDLKRLVDRFEPDILFISGWMDKVYLKIARISKKNGITVVAGLDTPWKHSLKQFISSIFLKMYWSNHFDYFWVPGGGQYHYAVQLGFQGRILKNLYSADVNLFQQAWETGKKHNYPRKLLFIGRLEPHKGIMDLINTFLSITSQQRSGWELVIVGNGPLENEIKSVSEVKLIGFLDPNSLKKEMSKAGAFCLPSHWEPWGVVIHEAAAAGLPLLLSDQCGAAETFLEEGLNGFLFKAGDLKDLKNKLIRLFTMSSESLFDMGLNSHKFSNRITPELSAETLINVLGENRY